MNLSDTIQYAVITIVMFIVACLLVPKVAEIATELLNQAVNVPIK